MCGNELQTPDFLCTSKARKNVIVKENVCVFVFVCEQQEKVQIRKELWRIEDVIAGLSASKANYKVTISSVTNPGETRVTWRLHVYRENCICCLSNAMPRSHAAVSYH